MPLNKRVFGYEMTFLSKTAMAMVVASIAVSGCTSMQIGDTMYNGYVAVSYTHLTLPTIYSV